MSTETEMYAARNYSTAARTQVTGNICKTWSYDYGPNGISDTSCFKTKTGTKLHDWKRRIARGVNATTAFTGDISDISSEPAYQHIYGSTSSNPLDFVSHRKCAARWSHGISVPGLPPLADVTTATNIASTRFYKQLESTMTAFQGGVFLAELREALHMIRNPAQSLRKKIGNYLDHLATNRKRMMRKPPNNRLQWLSDSWLEYSFGWAPTCADIDSAAKYLDRRQNQLVQELVPILGIGRAESTSFAEAVDIVGITYMRSMNRSVFQTQRIYAGAVSSRAAGTTLMSTDSLGLSPRSFVPTLWEAMPYSFAIDYFTNIGDVLSAWSNQNVRLAWGRDTLRRSTVVESTGVYQIPSSALVLIFDYFDAKGKTTARRKTVDRQPISYVPIPGISFEMPGFGRKWINISALATARQSLRFR